DFGFAHLSLYQIKHTQVAGDWTAVRKLANDDLIVLEVDVTGKGLQAALVVHAIQSIWAEALGVEEFDIDQWARKLNRTLFRMGERRPHSATLGILRVSQDRISYWCLGHTPLFVVTYPGGKAHLAASRARGSVLG